MDVGQSTSRLPVGRGRSRRRSSHIFVPHPDHATAAESRRKRKIILGAHRVRGLFPDLVIMFILTM